MGNVSLKFVRDAHPGAVKFIVGTDQRSTGYPDKRRCEYPLEQELATVEHEFPFNIACVSSQRLLYCFCLDPSTDRKVPPV